MTETAPNIGFGDLETTGLIASDHHVLEVAFIVTDSDLNVLDTFGFHRVVGYSPDEVRSLWAESDTFVRNMHEVTGLWDKLPHGAPLRDVDEDLREYLSGFGDEARTMPVGGNSNRLDMNFMDVHLPLTAGFLSYRARDVSQLAGFVHDWYPDEPWFEKASDHTAMTDITECIREVKHYREVLKRRGYDSIMDLKATAITSAADWAADAVKS